MAARATPMTNVLVSSVSPRYGASSRSDTTSTTSTLAEAPKTKAAAAYRPSSAESVSTAAVAPDLPLIVGLPATLAPLREMWTFSAERGVVTVAGMHHGGVVEAVEDLAFKIIHQGREVLGSVGLTGTAGEQTVACEQMRDAAVLVPERDRTRRMTDQPDHLEPFDAQLDMITVPDSDHALDRGTRADRIEIRLAADQPGPGSGGDWR